MPQTTSAKARKAAFALVGAMVGMAAVSCWIGGVIGWEQSGQWPAWLAVPLGVGMGPMYLIGDLMTLSDGSLQDMIALPQALVGGAVGGALGWLVASVRK
ncbi:MULTISPECIES: hypothetical protein [unclassified Duganella]|uniref:hypothetical protein n=1 Tax=unclassified Duganella TaxID=2636909 RepID=UPI0006F37408|nr:MULTISPECIES: hypothetical protein [unclassified Duganella]KQV50989.1 hypothetical protein ASD07_08685 [Duganella sp. Root336D2]KRC00567.1 hypothetical protein ASE26_22885 [Duganella sp. Root198D2]